jgi:hypothetical protein
MNKKKDTGYLPSGIKEELRDKLAKRDWQKAPTKDKANPNHLTSKELEANQWSGVRTNPLTQDLEIWILGQKAKSISSFELSLNSAAFHEALCEIFATNGIEIVDPVEIMKNGHY